MTSVVRKYASYRGRSSRPGTAPDDGTRAPVVLMVSGGADSTALLLLAVESELDVDDGRGLARIARERLHVLHVNHQLRGADSMGDEDFVRDLCRELGVPCAVRRVDVPGLAAKSGPAGGNVENVGREERYRLAAELANQLSAQFGTPRSAARILTAHTANDRAETFFMNAIRGTGASGLASIPLRRNRIVRPLLGRTHEELCELLSLKGVAWREDATNADTRYLRSFVRHELMPVALGRNPRLVSALSSTCEILSDEDAYLGQVAARSYRELVRRRGGGVVALDARRLGASDVAIARRVVRLALLEMSPAARIESAQVARVLSMVARGNGSCSVILGVDARVEYGLLFLRTPRQATHVGPSWLDVPGSIALPDGRSLAARVTSVPTGSSPEEVARAHSLEWGGRSVYLDAVACGVSPSGRGRLWVDAPAAGDVMCPLGMHGQSKKLSDLLNEARIPAADRSEAPVVRSGPTGSVLWVAPLRCDERVRCTPATRLVLELTLA